MKAELTAATLKLIPCENYQNICQNIFDLAPHKMIHELVRAQSLQRYW